MTQVPLFQPPSEWLPPERLPELREAKEIAIDLETNDPGLRKTGPGWATGNGYIAGVALGIVVDVIWFPGQGHEIHVSH